MEQFETLIPAIIHHPTIQRAESSQPFIISNTLETTLDEMRNDHIIPVFTKDNETLISHVEFIENVHKIAAEIFQGETILKPIIRLSHPIKGRVPEAKDKPASELYPWEKTLYYERMMFAIEIPSIQSEIDGNLLSLTLGGVKSYGEDNLYSKSQSDQHFKVFIGFQNEVCTNLCVWTDGYLDNLRVRSEGMLRAHNRDLFQQYNHNFHLHHLRRLAEYSITEEQFAHLVGKCRMYTHLPNKVKRGITPVTFGDQQMGVVVKDFYKDESFCRDQQGNINLWRLYNLFTGANKTSYIDSFLDRSVSVWGSWCVPCRKSHPALKELYAKYKSRGLEIIGISNEAFSAGGSKAQQDASWRKAIKEDGIDWLHVLNDADINDLAKSHDINGYPTKFLIDRNGKFVLKILGTSEGLHKTLEKKLAELMPD